MSRTTATTAGMLAFWALTAAGGLAARGTSAMADDPWLVFPGGDGPGSGNPIEVTGSGSLDVDPFQTAGCTFVPEPGAAGAGAAGAALLALAARRRCAASSSA